MSIPHKRTLKKYLKELKRIKRHIQDTALGPLDSGYYICEEYYKEHKPKYPALKAGLVEFLNEVGLRRIKGFSGADYLSAGFCYEDTYDGQGYNLEKINHVKIAIKEIKITLYNYKICD